MTHKIPNIIRLVSFSLAGIVGPWGIANAQEMATNQNSGNDPTPCAVIRNQLDRSMIEFAKDENRFAEHNYLIVIVRAGKSERAGKLSRDRIRILRDFFELRRQTKNVIFAEAERNEGKFGSGEIYINGALTERFYFKYQQSQPCSSVEESW